MHYLKRMTKKNGEEAVSPVVGVMLMLVVTIIIAAVVSGFAGGLVSNGQSKSPTLSMDVQIVNTGSYIGSGFSANVRSVSQPISTKNLKIVTSWSTTMKSNSTSDVGLSTVQQAIPNGAIFTGGSTVLPNSANVVVYQGMKTNKVTNWATAPFGMSQAIIAAGQSNPTDPIGSSAAAYQSPGWFGQYTLEQGVNLFAYPFGTLGGESIAGAPGQAATSGYNGATPYVYASMSGNYVQGQVDPTQAVLGLGWEELRAGDIVNVKVIYTPTGTTIFSAAVPVTEA